MYNVEGKVTKLARKYVTMDGTPCNCKGSFILSKEAHPFRGGSVSILDQLSLERRTGIVTMNPIWIVSVAILILVGFLAGRTHKPR